jgi:hypothetical protein
MNAYRESTVKRREYLPRNVMKAKEQPGFEKGCIEEIYL